MNIRCSVMQPCHEIHKKVGEFLHPWTGRDYNDTMILGNTHIVVAQDDDADRWVGIAMLILITDPFFNRYWGLVENVYITPEYRHLGIGKLLMKSVEFTAMALGCEFIKLTTRKPEGRSLYIALGYDAGDSFYKQVSPVHRYGVL